MNPSETVIYIDRSTSTSTMRKNISSNTNRTNPSLARDDNHSVPSTNLPPNNHSFNEERQIAFDDQNPSRPRDDNHLVPSTNSPPNNHSFNEERQIEFDDQNEEEEDADVASSSSSTVISSTDTIWAYFNRTKLWASENWGWLFLLLAAIAFFFLLMMMIIQPKYIPSASTSPSWTPCPFAGAVKLTTSPDIVLRCAGHKPIECIQVENQFIFRRPCGVKEHVSGPDLESVATLETVPNSCEPNCATPVSSNANYTEEALVINRIHENILRRRISSKEYAVSRSRVRSSELHGIDPRHDQILRNASYISIKFIMRPGHIKMEDLKQSTNVTKSGVVIEKLQLSKHEKTTLINNWKFFHSTDSIATSSYLYVIPMEPKCKDCLHCQVAREICAVNIPFIGGGCYALGTSCSFSMREFAGRYIGADRLLSVTKILSSTLLCH